jgi:hypothetical protein
MLKIRTTSVIFALMCLAGAVSSACNDERATPAQTESTGTVSVPLVAVTPAGSYRLESATFDIAGPVSLSVAPDADAALFTEQLAPGDYTIGLQSGWTLTKLVDGVYQPLTGVELTTDNPLAFSVGDGSHQTLQFVFDVDGASIELGYGTVDVEIVVTGDEVTCAEGSVDLDGDPATGVNGCECTITDASDPLDAAFTDENCDGTDGVAASCVFVSASLGSSGGDGSVSDPLHTIAAGITAAQALGLSRVCLSGETYEESVTLVDGISLYGGFDQLDPDVPFRRNAAAVTTIEAAGTAVLANGLTQFTELQSLKIVAQTPTGLGGSTYGVRVIGGTLTLVANDILAERGQNGGAGPIGPSSGGPAPNGGNGSPGCGNCNGGGAGGIAPACMVPGGNGGGGGLNNQNGQPGSNGTNSTPGGAGGVASGVCFSQSGSGQPGTPGMNGITGPGGGGGQAIGAFASLYQPSNGLIGGVGTNGASGGGGGGGGGGSSTPLCTADRGGGGGAGGCAGAGGQGGFGGFGGGGSFSVYLASSATVSMTDNLLTTLGGGGGGAGGSGGPGQIGGNGGSGSGTADDAGGGAAGGKGGNGGAGGPGGGGGGGPTACIARQSSATVNGASACTLGSPGPGGSSLGGGMGAAGQAAATLVNN